MNIPAARVALNVLTLLSLALLGATAVLWQRSHRGCDALVRPAGPGDRLCITSEFGMLVFEVEGPVRGVVLPGWEYFETPVPRRWPMRTGRLGFEVFRGQITHYVRLAPSEFRGIAIPHGFAAIAFAALPTWWLARRRRQALARRGAEAGLCGRCGYDLRATPGRCPECGNLPLT